MGFPARKVETAGPGRYTDDRGLQLLMKSSGQRSWGLRYQADGRNLGLGPEITLAKARERRRPHRTRVPLDVPRLCHRGDRPRPWVIEATLARGLKDKAEAACACGDLLQKRRRLMEDCAEFVTRPNAQAGGILELRRASR